MQVQPVEGAMDGGSGGEAGDAEVGGGGHKAGSLGFEGSRAGYSTETRKRPRAGAVGPAAERLRAARMAGWSRGRRWRRFRRRCRRGCGPCGGGSRSR
jgi:hypothetical protein